MSGPSSDAGPGRGAPAATRGQAEAGRVQAEAGIVLLTLHYHEWRGVFPFRDPATPASILQQQLPELRNCRTLDTFYLDPYWLKPHPEGVAIPDGSEVHIGPEEPAHGDPEHQQVQISTGTRQDGEAGSSYFPFLFDVHSTPADVLQQIGMELAGARERTIWWERGPFGARRLHERLPLVLRSIGEGSVLHWELASVARAQMLRNWAWLPFARDGPWQWQDVELPVELLLLESRNQPPVALHSGDEWKDVEMWGQMCRRRREPLPRRRARTPHAAAPEPGCRSKCCGASWCCCLEWMQGVNTERVRQPAAMQGKAACRWPCRSAHGMRHADDGERGGLEDQDETPARLGSGPRLPELPPPPPVMPAQHGPVGCPPPPPPRLRSPADPVPAPTPGASPFPALAGPEGSVQVA